MLVFVVPKAFPAVIVWLVELCKAVGVPLIAHVEALIESPVGSPGLALHDVTVPLTVGVCVVIVVF